MSRLLEELRQILNQSEISLEDQNDLLIFLPILPKDSLEKLIKVFQKDSELIKEFNQNFKSKLKALVGKDTEEWDDVIEQEEKGLEESKGEENLDDLGISENSESEM
ncbi:MAG: hypothetical protein Athens101410_337 [Parcubacteria group bacterium Athens1014_10]|nr:MAG: hypothetical protein Athens101410_337 [Parcubacteria group bacterium Athens1014_10]TSD05153.1 MAG: hypothetical protein Athens071412_455 [Parcubacteria group bacterium Athens0714_12]